MSFDPDQDESGPVGCKHTLSSHVELPHPQTPHIFLLRVSVNSFFTQTVLVLGIALTHMWDLALGLADHEVGTGPSLRPVQVPLYGLMLSSA